MNTPRTTAARRKSHCEHLPPYVVDVEVCEQIERELIQTKMWLASCADSHMTMSREMRRRIAFLEKQITQQKNNEH